MNVFTNYRHGLYHDKTDFLFLILYCSNIPNHGKLPIIYRILKILNRCCGFMKNRDKLMRKIKLIKQLPIDKISKMKVEWV